MTTAWKVVTPGAIEVDGRMMFLGYRRPIPPKLERLTGFASSCRPSMPTMNF